jgi:hypothetical protein
MRLIDAIISALPDWFRRRIVRRAQISDWLTQISKDWR